MTKNEILEEYNFYNSAIKLFEKSEINESVCKMIPANWYEILKQDSQSNKIAKTICMWKILKKELSRTIDFLEEHLQDVDLVQIDNSMYLFYTIKTDENELIYYLGGNPFDTKIEEQEFSKKGLSILQSQRTFYEKLHNGFFDYCSKAMGLLQVFEVKCLSDDEWEILNSVKEIKINLNVSYSFFSNGLGDYVVTDLELQKSAVWFHDEEPVYGVDFWNVADEWLLMGLSE